MSPRDVLMLAGIRELEVLSQCVTIGPFDFGRTSGGGVAIDPPSPRPLVPDNGPEPPPPVQCARALSPAEAALAPVLLDADAARLEADGRVTLSGAAGAVGLRRPHGVLANPRGRAPPPARPPLLGAWAFVSIEGRPVRDDARMELLLRPHRLEWRSGCVHEVREIRVEGDTLRPGELDPWPVCERGRSEEEQAVERLLAGPVEARWGPGGRLTLAGSSATASLVPLTTLFSG